MRGFLLSLIPWCGFWFALTTMVYSYTGQWPDAWQLLAAFWFGIAWGARELL